MVHAQFCVVAYRCSTDRLRPPLAAILYRVLQDVVEFLFEGQFICDFILTDSIEEVLICLIADLERSLVIILPISL